MKELTCKDCARLLDSGICGYHGCHCDSVEEICNAFITEDGKFPLFCYLASNLNDMANEFVEEGYSKDGEQGWYFTKEPSKLFYDRETPKKMAKEYLLRLE